MRKRTISAAVKITILAARNPEVNCACRGCVDSGVNDTRSEHRDDCRATETRSERTAIGLNAVMSTKSHRGGRSCRLRRVHVAFLRHVTAVSSIASASWSSTRQTNDCRLTCVVNITTVDTAARARA